MRMLVLGAGLQGSACAFDLLQNADVQEVRIADLRVDHLPSFLTPYVGGRLIPTKLDVRDRDAVLAQMRDCQVVMSAIPYYFNEALAALDAKGAVGAAAASGAVIAAITPTSENGSGPRTTYAAKPRSAGTVAGTYCASQMTDVSASVRLTETNSRDQVAQCGHPDPGARRATAYSAASRSSVTITRSPSGATVRSAPGVGVRAPRSSAPTRTG